MFLLKDYQSFHHVLVKYPQNNLDIKDDPSANSNSLFHVGIDILNLSLLYDFLMFSMYCKY